MSFTTRYTHVDPHEVTHRLIRNPNYGGVLCEVPNSCVIPVTERKIKPEFFKALRKNVSETGFRNPIVLYRVLEHGLLLSFGGSRLRVGKELSIPIPTLVVDYVGDYADFPEVTPENYVEFFTDPPVYFEFTTDGIDTHYSLERLRRKYYDPAGMEWTKDIDDNTFLSEEFPWLNEKN